MSSGVEVQLPRIGGSSLRDRVASALEERIIDGRFPAGGRLDRESVSVISAWALGA